MNIRRRFESMLANLDANPKVDVEVAELGPPTDPSLIEQVRRDLGSSVPASVYDFYREISSFKLVWWAKLPEATRDNQSWSGRVDILPIDSALNTAGWDGVLWFDFTDSDHPFRRMRPIDFFIEEACTVLYPVPGDPQVCYHYCGEELAPTGLSFNDWIDRLLMSRGYWYWITAFTQSGGAEADNVREVLPKIFDDFDASLFVPCADPPLDV